MYKTPEPFRSPKSTSKAPRPLDSFRKALETCEQMGFDPIKEAILRYRDRFTPNSSKDACLKLIADRILPNLKAIELRQTSEEIQRTVINIVAGDVPRTVDAETVKQLEFENDA